MSALLRERSQQIIDELHPLMERGEAARSSFSWQVEERDSAFRQLRAIVNERRQLVLRLQRMLERHYERSLSLLVVSPIVAGLLQHWQSHGDTGQHALRPPPSGIAVRPGEL
jgi:hypothetical protein